MSNTFQSGVDKCPNCGTPNCPTYEDGVPAHAPEPVNPNKGTKPMYIERGVAVNAAYNASKKAKKEAKHEFIDKDRQHAEDDEDTIKDVYTVEFDACMDGFGIDNERKKRLSVDEQKDEVMKSCLDLAIDG